MNGQSAATIEKSILSELDEVDRLLSALTQSLSELEGRIEPILKPATLPETENKTPVSLSSPAGGKTEIAANLLQDLNNKIHGIRNRVEL